MAQRNISQDRKLPMGAGMSPEQGRVRSPHPGENRGLTLLLCFLASLTLSRGVEGNPSWDLSAAQGRVCRAREYRRQSSEELGAQGTPREPAGPALVRRRLRLAGRVCRPAQPCR